MTGRRDPRLIAQRQAAALDLNAHRWGRAGVQAKGRAARNGRSRSHQPISVPAVDAFHTATPRAELRPDRTWYAISNEITGGAVDVWIYDEIGWFGITAQEFVLELATVQAGQLNVHLNSPGGEVFDGIAIYNALVSHPAKVHVTVDALAASIASVIAMAGDTLTMGRHSQLMIHEPYGMCLGNAADMATMIEQLDRCADNIAGVYADRAGGSVDAWREAMRAETWYTGAEAVTAGLADEVVANPRGETAEPEGVEEVAARWDLSVFAYAGRAEAPRPDLTVRSKRAKAHTTTVPDPEPAPDPPADPPPPAPEPPAAEPPAGPDPCDQVPDFSDLADPLDAVIAAFQPPVFDPEMFSQTMKEARS